ncbi:MAG: 3-phosphoshikimate 1-carboxyvinyltransferase [Fibrobacteraceae bacterium]|nr:3-phosphoshikimate 1-carboxyvinyltransferase [Fibrobacteraceae bacterium]
MLEFYLNPDRELSEDVLIMGLLVNGRTTLDDFSFTPRSRAFVELLSEFGLTVEEKGAHTVLSGVGFSYKVPALLKLPESDNALALFLALASKDAEMLYTATGNPDVLARAKKMLSEIFGAVLDKEEEASFVFHFSESLPVLKETREGYVPYLAKNAVFLNALVLGKNVEIEEHSPIRTGFVDMLAYFGASIKMETTGAEEMSELERRMAKARGIKTERKVKTIATETKILTSHDYFVPSDATEACAFVSLAVLSPVFKDKPVTLKNVQVSLDRAGAFSALKRMGANINFTNRHERYGTAYADVTAVYEKRLSSRRLTEDILCTCLEEYPFIALAASTADGESILRIPDSLSKVLRPKCEFLASNLKKTGSGIGVYEEGLVVRGREGLDAGEFDAGNDPILAILFLVLSLFANGETVVHNTDSVENTFPGICDKLKSMAAE